MVKRLEGAMELVGGKSASDIQTSQVRSKVEHWQELGGIVAEAANYAATIAHKALAEQVLAGELKPMPGLKDMVTVAAILVDKGAVIDTTLSTLGQTRGADLLDLEKRIALLLAAQTELQRRAQAAAPVDVTPKP